MQIAGECYANWRVRLCNLSNSCCIMLCLLFLVSCNDLADGNKPTSVNTSVTTNHLLPNNTRQKYIGNNQMIDSLLEQNPVQYFTGSEDIKIAYRHFMHSENPASKLMILVNGRTEHMLKWAEIVNEFYQDGYDVLAFDHRGQGNSQRLLPDSEKGYVDNFDFYVADMNNLITKITEQYNYKTKHLLAHSMGGLITTLYLAQYPHTIDKVAFTAPFLGANRKYPKIDKLVINLMILMGQKQNYVFGSGPYQSIDPAQNVLTSSVRRIEQINQIDDNNPEIRLGGVTYNWINESLNKIATLPTEVSKIKIPSLIIMAGNDALVSNEQIKKLAPLFKNCQLKLINDSKHEILFEQNGIRQLALEYIKQFLS